MRTFLKAITLAAMILPVAAFADEEVEISKNITFVKVVDDFTDVATCGVLIISGDDTLSLFPNYTGVGKVGIGTIRKNIGAIGVHYRVDKNKATMFGYQNAKDTSINNYLFKGAEFSELVSNFKSGNSAVIKLISSNQYVDNSKMKVSLSGFTKAYDMAVECK